MSNYPYRGLTFKKHSKPGVRDRAVHQTKTVLQEMVRDTKTILERMVRTTVLRLEITPPDQKFDFGPVKFKPLDFKTLPAFGNGEVKSPSVSPPMSPILGKRAMSTPSRSNYRETSRSPEGRILAYDSDPEGTAECLGMIYARHNSPVPRSKKAKMVEKDEEIPETESEGEEVVPDGDDVKMKESESPSAEAKRELMSPKPWGRGAALGEEEEDDLQCKESIAIVDFPLERKDLLTLLEQETQEEEEEEELEEEKDAGPNGTQIYKTEESQSQSFDMEFGQAQKYPGWDVKWHESQSVKF